MTKLLRCCTVCRRHIGLLQTAPETAPLPMVKVQDVPPFTITGVYFTSALYVRQHNGEEQKEYICLFIGATSREVHLEVVTDLSTATFLLAFRHLATTTSNNVWQRHHLYISCRRIYRIAILTDQDSAGLGRCHMAQRRNPGLVVIGKH